MIDGRLFPLPEPMTVAVDGEPSASAQSTLNGALSEQAAIDRLLRLGYKVAVPVIDDDGVDLVVNYRHTVQVKSTQHINRGGQSWVFSAARAWYRGGSLYKYATKPGTATFFVCHAVPIDAWWVVPRQQLHEAGWPPAGLGFSLVSDPVRRTKYAALSAACRDAWHLLA